MGSQLRTMHGAGLALVLFVFAKELVADPDPLDVLNVHLHLDELEDAAAANSDGNRQIQNGGEVCKNVICNSNRELNRHWPQNVCCHNKGSSNKALPGSETCKNVICNVNKALPMNRQQSLCCDNKGSSGSVPYNKALPPGSDAKPISEGEEVCKNVICNSNRGMNRQYPQNVCCDNKGSSGFVPYNKALPPGPDYGDDLCKNVICNVNKALPMNRQQNICCKQKGSDYQADAKSISKEKKDDSEKEASEQSSTNKGKKDDSEKEASEESSPNRALTFCKNVICNASRHHRNWPHSACCIQGGGGGGGFPTAPPAPTWPTTQGPHWR